MISKTVLFAFGATTLIVATFAFPSQDKDKHSLASSPPPVTQVTPSLNKTISNARVRRDGGGGGGGGLGGGGGGGGGRGGGGGGGGGGLGGGGGGGGGGRGGGGGGGGGK